jgi:hypothetical protein
MHEAQGYFLHAAGVAERDSSAIRKRITVVRVPALSFFFSFWISFILTNTQTVLQHIHYLITVSKVTFAPLAGIEMRVTQMFVIFP